MASAIRQIIDGMLHQAVDFDAPQLPGAIRDAADTPPEFYHPADDGAEGHRGFELESDEPGYVPQEPTPCVDYSAD